MNVAVIGVGHTKFGELWDQSINDLLAHAQLEAFADARLKPQAIDEIYTANMCAGMIEGQLHLGALAAEVIGVDLPATRIEAACVSGSLALRAGMMAIASKQAEVVLVSGVEKMTDVSNDVIATTLFGASDVEAEKYTGVTFPGLFAMITRSYFHKYGITRKDLAHVSVKNHAHAALNPLAHLRKSITHEQVLASSMVADPLSLLDCSLVSDGAAAVVLCSKEFAEKNNYTPIYITGSGASVDSIHLAARDDITTFQATNKAAQKAFAMAGVTPDDIDVLEVHDAFTMAEIMAVEDLGFVEKGKGAHAIASGEMNLDGRLPTNPSGGLKAKGHPVGATGVAQAVEIVKQLRGECGQRQVDNAKIGLTHNVGGIGTTVAVHIFQKEV